MTSNIDDTEQLQDLYFKKVNMFNKQDLFDVPNEETANYIYKNYKKILEDENLLKETHNKITSSRQMIKDIFTYDFLFYEPPEAEKINTLDKLVDITRIELAKYQGIVGGYEIEDDEWLDCTPRFKLKENQKGIFNTCTKKTIDNKDHIWFLKNMIKRIKKFISNNNICIKYDMFDDEFNEIIWIVFIFEEK